MQLPSAQVDGRQLHPVPVHACDEDVPEALVERERACRAAPALGLPCRLAQQPGGEQRVHPLRDGGPREPGDPDQVAAGRRDPPPDEQQQPARRHRVAGPDPLRVDHRNPPSALLGAGGEPFGEQSLAGEEQRR